MKLETKPSKKGTLVKYYDNRWLTKSELSLTPEGIGANLDANAIANRLRGNKKPDTLEILLGPKRGYRKNTLGVCNDFKGVDRETIGNLKSGNNLKLLKGNDKSIKIKGTLSIPNVYKKPLITKEIKIDKDKYNGAVDKDDLIYESFIHAISNYIKVDCVEIIECG